LDGYSHRRLSNRFYFSMSTEHLPFSTPQYTEQDLELLATVLQATSTGVVITDHQQPDEPIIFCNPAFEKLSGYSRTEIIGRNCRFLQGEDRNQEARDKIKEAIEKELHIQVQIRNYTADGTLFWNDLIMSPVKNKDGKVTHFVGIQTDVTRRKEAEAALHLERQELENRVEQRTKTLKESEEYLESIVQTIRESLLVLDKNLNVLSANPHFYKTFKVSATDTVGKNIFELGRGQWNIPALRQLLEHVLPNNNPFEGYEVVADFPHIGRKNMLLNAYQIEYESNYKDRILLAFEDVTERKEAERRKDDFLGVASHELKTPLTSIKGYLQIAKMTLPDNASPKLGDVITKAEYYSDKLNALIKDLLDVSKIQAGKLEFNKANFDFDKMVHEAVDGIQAANPDYTVTITGQTEQQCHGDKDRLEQVVQNLLTNAIKYSPNVKEVKVHVSQASNFLKLAITDFGVGIEQKDYKKIFERFYRVDDVQKQYPGMGIGLYVCEQIIKQHEGSLWVESQLGKGSTFSFVVPATKSNQPS
jgi:PAS domain S-box-containing protein